MTAARSVWTSVFWLEHKQIAVGVSGLSDLLRCVWLERTTCTPGRCEPVRSINQDLGLFDCTLLQAGDPLMMAYF